MAVTITGGKYAIQALTAAGTTTVTIGTGTFVSGDFGATQRMVALFTSANAFKGIAWVRRFTSTTVLELENRFVDPVTGVYATQAVGDKVMVAKNSAESAVTGFTVTTPDNNVVTVSDNVVMGTAGSEISLCFYEENKQYTMTNGFQFVGGVAVFGKLMSYDGVSKESFIWSRECTARPNEGYPLSGTPAYNLWGTGGTSAHMFFFGGAIGSPMRRSFFIGAEGTSATNKTYALYGTRIYHACASPGGGNWASNADRHLLYKTIHEADYNNADLIQWGNGAFQGSFLSFPQYGAGTPLGVFRANSAVTFGASTNSRTIVNDLGTGAFIDDINNGTYTFTNTITPAVSIVRHPGGATPITMQFQDDYTNLKTNTTVVLRRTVDSVVASSVVNTSNSTFTATAVQATYSATANGVATPTASYSSFDYTVKCYGYQAISGNHSTYSYSLGTGGTGTDLKLGGLVNQVADSTVTLSLAAALALSSKISGNSATDTCTISASATLDEQYDYLVAWGCSSAALAQYPSLSTYPVGASGTTSQQLMKLVVSAGATFTAGTKLQNLSGAKNFLINGTTTLVRGTVTWAPAAYADQWQVGNGGVLNLTGGTLFTVNPTTGLGYGTGATAMFRSGSTLNLSDSTVVYNVVSGGSGTFFSNSEAGSTWNISNSTLTLNCPNGAQVAIHAYFLPASVINNFTVNGTASNVIWQMGYTSNNSKMVGFKYGGAIFGNGTSNILMDTYTYTGALTSIPNTFGSANKWWWVDPTMQAGGLFRWAAGATATGSSGFYGVIGFRPTFTIDKTGYAPKMRVKPSAMASRYPTQIFNTTALSTVARSNFFRDPTFMDSSDGFLPFLDSLDSKTVLNTIDWEVQVRQAGWQDLTQTFTAATAKTGLITAAFAGVVDAYYVNASTGLADSALISVDTGTKTISAVSGSLTWSPQRLYNALKNWWATYASDTDFLSTTSGSTLKLGDYNVASNISFIEGNSSDVLTAISTTGLINAATNEIPITDSRGTSTIWQFENISVGSSIIVYDASGVTKYFQQEVTTAGNYIYYIQPGTTGTYSWAIELYGKQRQSGSFAANTGGLLFYEPIYVEDIGVSVTNKSTVAAYTAIDNLDKFYDYTAYRRLSEDFIKIGQIATRSGTAVEIGNYNLTVNAAASVMESITGSTITIKSGVLAAGSKYNTIIATPPKLVTAATTEVITANIQDGAGDSSVTIQGGSGDFTLWKLLNSVPDDDYATGVNLGDVGNITFRFLHADGYKIVIRDNSTAYRISCPMEQGIYTRGLFFGDQVQLAQSAEVTQINTKVDILTNNVAAVPAAILSSTVETGATVVESLRLHNSVLGGKVSGGGSGVETFRDLADTKDRLISTNDATGNRTSEVTDLT